MAPIVEGGSKKVPTGSKDPAGVVDDPAAVNENPGDAVVAPLR